MSLAAVAQFLIRHLNSRRSSAARDFSAFESLENRTLFSAALPDITNLIADNRGLVQMTINHGLVPNTVNSGSVQMFTAGPDRQLNTRDDVKVPAAVNWLGATDQIQINGQLPANTAYRVRVISARIHDTKGIALDGEYRGKLPTGNGKAGGDFVFKTRVDSGNAPKVQMTTSAGILTITLYNSQKPTSVANFLSYANAGDYDNIFWTRSVPKFIIQAGGLGLDSTQTTIQEVPQNAPIQNEFTDNGVISNTRGTIAFAKQPNDPDSATNQFFFNLSNNGGTSPLGLDFQNGGFTVFGKLDKPSLKVMDTIAAFPVVPLNNPVTGDGVAPVFASASLTATPIKATNPLNYALEDFNVPGMPNYTPNFQYVAVSGFVPTRDLIIIQRTAELMRVQAIT